MNVLKLLAALVALSAVPALPASTAGGAVHSIDVFNFGFTDAGTGTPVTIAAVGDTVVFTVSSGVHTASDGVAGRANPVGSSFDSGVMSAGDSFSITLGESGVVLYTCKLHASMQGMIVVQ